MISDEKLRELINQSEGSGLEFKKSLHFLDNIGQSVCAFANSGGGMIIFGIERTDQKNVIIGLVNSDEAYQRLAAIMPQLDPKPRYTTQELILEEKKLILLEIESMPISDVCFYKKNVYVRYGSVNRELTKHELIDFLRARGVISFEENKSTADINDLDKEKIIQYLDNRGIDKKKLKEIGLETLLASLGVANASGLFYIKNVGVLFFAKDITRFFSNSEIRIVKYKGKEPDLRAREFDQRIGGTALEILEKSYAITREKAGFYSKIIKAKRIEVSMIPDEVLREAITNAVGHRDYFDPNGVLIEIFDDRIQLTNPGNLLPGQTLKNFADIRRHRNPILHRLINDVGWGEGLNLGVRAMIRIMRQSSLPDPVFDDLGGFFRVTLYGPLSKKVVKPYGEITERQRKALAYLEKHESITAPLFAKLAGISHPTAIIDLNELIAQGYLKRIGSQRSSRYIKETK